MTLFQPPLPPSQSTPERSTLSPGMSPTASPTGMMKIRPQRRITPYSAPELLAQGTCSAKSDMWAAGVVLYEMVTGAKPFAASDASELARCISGNVRAPISTPSVNAPKGDHTPADVQFVIDGLLHTDPEQRMTAEAALKSPFIQRSLMSLRKAVSPKHAILPHDTADAVRRAIDQHLPPMITAVHIMRS